jgi:hypothetical protein
MDGLGDDPMMFMAGQKDAEGATNHYVNLYRVTFVFISLLQEILLAMLDSDDVKELGEAYRRFVAQIPRPDWPKSR